MTDPVDKFLSDAISAARAEADDGVTDGAHTRLRLRESLANHGTNRRKRFTLIAAVIASLFGSTAFAYWAGWRPPWSAPSVATESHDDEATDHVSMRLPDRGRSGSTKARPETIETITTMEKMPGAPAIPDAGLVAEVAPTPAPPPAPAGSIETSTTKPSSVETKPSTTSAVPTKSVVTTPSSTTSSVPTKSVERTPSTTTSSVTTTPSTTARVDTKPSSTTSSVTTTPSTTTRVDTKPSSTTSSVTTTPSTTTRVDTKPSSTTAVPTKSVVTTPSSTTSSVPTKSVERTPSATTSSVATTTPVDTKPSSTTSSITTTPSTTTPVDTTPMPTAPRVTNQAPRVEASQRSAELVAYRNAHTLHFRGGDPKAALAAWDAYLAKYPNGTLAPEARYDRALVLVKLARWAEARAALAPFANGTVNAGYRQKEAAEILAAIRDR